jgi:hypothetical protein
MNARTLVPLAFLAALAGCASYESWRFGPNPVEIPVWPEGAEEPTARALVSVRGLRDRESGGERRTELVVGLRIENRLDQPLALVPAEAQLVDADLTAFGPPSVHRADRPGELEIAAGKTAVFELGFPLPAGRDPGDLDLSGLNLRWSLEGPRGLTTVSSTFQRLRRAYPYDPYYDPYYRDPFAPHTSFHFGFGFGC